MSTELSFRGESSTVITHPEVDVVVLGMGHVGGPVSAELSLAGYKVVGIEKGPYWDFNIDFTPSNKQDELAISINRKFDTPHNYWTCTIRNNRNQFANPVRRATLPIQYHTLGHGVGGAGTHWGGGLGRYGPWPFQAYSNTVSRYGASVLPSNHDMEDWPITYQDAMPYYEAWEKAIGVAGDKQAPFLPGFENYSYPNPPHPFTPWGELFRDTVESMGYHPYPSVSGLSSQSYVNQYGVTRNACVYCGYCGEQCNYVCEVGAKASSHVTTVPAALATGNFDLRLETWAFRIDTDSTGTKATAVRYWDNQGNVHVQPAKVVYNALWGFNIIRIMMMSGIGTAYNPVTVSGSLGRAVTNGYAPSTTSTRGTLAMGANAYSAGNAAGGGFTMDDFADDNFDHTSYQSGGAPFIGGEQFGVGGYLGSGPALFTLAMPVSATNWGSKWKAGIKDVKLPTKIGVGLGGAGTEIPTTDWYIDLDPHYTDIHGDPAPRMTLDWGPNRYRVPTALAPKAEEILNKMGVQNVTTTKVAELSQNVDWWGHHMRGGARMGKDPATSVFNKWCQSWQVENLFAAGEIVKTQGDNTTAGTHVAGMMTYLAADGIKKYLANPGPLA